MIANARMYSVNSAVAALWRQLLQGILEPTGSDITVIEHAAPEPIGQLWERADKAAVFMCGLPYSRAMARPVLIAAPVPSPQPFLGQPIYWSEFVVRRDSPFSTLEDTFGQRLALTTPDSQSGCLAALHHLMRAPGPWPLYSEIVAPQITPQGAARAVAQGQAEVAPIDSFAFCLLEAHEPELTAQLRVVGRTENTPIPPLVGSDAALKLVQNAFLQAHQVDSIQGFMEQLRLERFVLPDPSSYDVLRQRYAIAARFWHEHALASVAHPAFAELTPPVH